MYRAQVPWYLDHGIILELRFLSTVRGTEKSVPYRTVKYHFGGTADNPDDIFHYIPRFLNLLRLKL